MPIKPSNSPLHWLIEGAEGREARDNDVKQVSEVLFSPCGRGKRTPGGVTDHKWVELQHFPNSHKAFGIA